MPMCIMDDDNQTERLDAGNCELPRTPYIGREHGVVSVLPMSFHLLPLGCSESDCTLARQPLDLYCDLC